MKYVNVVIFALILANIGCSSQKETATADRQQSKQGERKGRPSVDEIFKMDANGDGKLSKEEVHGPLQRDFSKIDSNGDGFISRAELENGPKPQRGQRPPKNK